MGQEELGGHPGGQGGYGRPSRRAGKGQEALQKEGGGVASLSLGPVWVGRPSRWARRVWKALPERREGLKGPPGGLGGVKRDGRGWESP